MTRPPGSLRALLFGDRFADRVVPPSGFSASLTIFAAGAMAFLAVFALALAVSSGRLASTWADTLTGTATVRILAPLGERAAQTDAVLRVLETTGGVRSARALSDAEQADLLAPWFGSDLALDDLPVPRLIAVETDPDVFDAAGLRLRLTAEAPAAVLDSHDRWREPLARAATRLRWIAWSTGLLIAASVAAIVTLAANAALAANARIIAVLRLVGATDGYIAGAFIRRFTYRASVGGLAGTLLGLLAVVALPSGGDASGILTGFGFAGAGWLLPVLVPILCAMVAFAATAYAARRTLKELL